MKNKQFKIGDLVRQEKTSHRGIVMNIYPFGSDDNPDKVEWVSVYWVLKQKFGISISDFLEII